MPGPSANADAPTLRAPGRWSSAIFSEGSPRGAAAAPLGVLHGEGIGREVISAALDVLRAVERRRGSPLFPIRFGGPVGVEAERLCGQSLSPAVTDFCQSVFESGGAILAGPGGSRFVYELRARFDLFCKISPIRVSESLAVSGQFRSDAVRGVDFLIVRENAGGMYMGEASMREEPGEGRVCEHRFRYSEREVRRIVDVAASLAASRRGGLAVVVKDGGMPVMTSLWRDVAEASASRRGLRPVFWNVDLASYALVRNPLAFDVVVAPNLFGDVLADGASVLLGSRGLSFSGNFSASGAAVYQTNHGGAADIAGRDAANPLGQIAALAMALRESFGLHREADWMEDGIEAALRQGCRTFDIAAEGCDVLGTREMGARVAAAVASPAADDRP